MEMSYEEARSHIKDGDIVFTRKKSLTSIIIRFFTRSNYSHVGIAFWAKIGGKKRLMMVEAQGGTKRRIVNISFYRKHMFDVVEGPREWNEIADAALGRIAEASYGWLEAGYVGLREFLIKYVGIKIPRLNMPGEICSEFVARTLELPKQHVSPQLLFEQLEEMGYKIKVRVH